MNYNIKHITPKEVYIVRHPVLRAGKPIESCIFEGDDFKTSFHLGIYTQNYLVGVCTFMKNNHPLLTEAFQYQLRGMAVLDEYQGLGLGAIILTYGETLLKEKNIDIIWCNAREKASKFYKKIGYKIIGDPFDIKDIGLHYIMCKVL